MYTNTNTSVRAHTHTHILIYIQKRTTFLIFFWNRERKEGAQPEEESNVK